LKRPPPGIETAFERLERFLALQGFLEVTSTAAGTRLPYTHPQERTKAFPFAVSFLQNSPFTGYGERAFFERLAFSDL